VAVPDPSTALGASKRLGANAYFPDGPLDTLESRRVACGIETYRTPPLFLRAEDAVRGQAAVAPSAPSLASGTRAALLPAAGAALAAWQSVASRTNLLLRSAELDNAAWTKLNTTITANADTAPDGTATMDRIVETADTGNHLVSQSATVVSGTVYTASFYVKASGRTRCRIVLGGAAFPATSVIFNLTTGAASVITGTPTAFSMTEVATGVWRIQASVAATSSASGLAQLRLDNGSADSYAGDTGQGLLAWGAQLEAAAVATPYIATTTAAVTVPTTVGVRTVPTDARLISLKNLPAGYTLSAGDRLSFVYGSPSRRALHRVMAPSVVADLSGNTAEFHIDPPRRPGAEVDAVVTLVRPVCMARIVPGSVAVGTRAGQIVQNVRFAWQQDVV
jgi:hypothetical protein